MLDSERRRRVIAKWFDETLQTGGIERLDDLHVDDIDAAWESKSTWFRAGLEAFDIAVEVRNQKKSPVTIALAYALTEVAAPQQFAALTARQIAASLNWMPPSLYVFHPDKEPWRQAPPARIPLAIFDNSPNIREAWYAEWRSDRETDISRTIWITG